ncbi:hypothetical protein OAK38_06335 [Verrucomicrobia bacterium]|nr:hypothetical protein [Verrucomicrobiota bacterium]
MSKGLGLVIFGGLLILVIIAFVTITDSGQSMWDHVLSDDQIEKQEFYGYDLNDPKQRRLLNLQNRVAFDLSVAISPYGDVIRNPTEQLSQEYQATLNFLENRLSFQAEQNLITQFLEMRKSFEEWVKSSRNGKANFIARRLPVGPEFDQSSLRVKLVMDAQADAWGLIPLQDNIPAANESFVESLALSNPDLALEENRSSVFEEIGKFRGISAQGVEDIAYSYFRASLVDEIYYDAGFVLEEEAKMDLSLNDFAWDAEALSLGLDDLGDTGPFLAKLAVSELPRTGDSLTISYGDQKRNFICVEQMSDLNSSDVQFLRGKDVAAFLKNLSESIEKQDLGFSASVVESTTLAFSPDVSRLPVSFPSFQSSSPVLSFSDELVEPLKAFHKERKNEDVFAEPARTLASMVAFRSKDFFDATKPPDEARMRSYFERNKEFFDLPPPPPLLKPEANATSVPPEGEQGPVGQNETNATGEVDLLPALVPDADLNVTKTKELAFEDVREEVRQRIIEGDRINAERDAQGEARKRALDFLIAVNDLGDELRAKYSSYDQLLDSVELNKLIEDARGVRVPVDFSEKEMEDLVRVHGLEKKAVLEEVASLTEKKFFSRSRKTRDGFAVFLLKGKKEKGPGSFADASFSVLFQEYARQLRSDQFVKLADRTLEGLQGDNNTSLPSLGLKVEIERRNDRLARGYFDGVNRRIGSQFEKLQEEREVISSAERESNATKDQLERKEAIDAEIEVIREKQADVNKEMGLVMRLSEACSNLTPDGKWSELERTENSSFFVRLKKVYTLRAGELDASEIESRAGDLQFARAQRGRDLLLRDIISRELEEKE